MAWDPSKQFQTQDRSSTVEFGRATLGSDGTVEVATSLSTILSAIVVYKDFSGGAVPVLGALTCDNTITSGAVTITDDVAGALNSGVTIQYTFRGYN